MTEQGPLLDTTVPMYAAGSEYPFDLIEGIRRLDPLTLYREALGK